MCGHLYSQRKSVSELRQKVWSQKWEAFATTPGEGAWNPPRYPLLSPWHKPGFQRELNPVLLGPGFPIPSLWLQLVVGCLGGVPAGCRGMDRTSSREPGGKSLGPGKGGGDLGGDYGWSSHPGEPSGAGR